MGALIGALYAELGNVVRTTQRAREACQVLELFKLFEFELLVILLL